MLKINDARTAVGGNGSDTQGQRGNDVIANGIGSRKSMYLSMKDGFLWFINFTNFPQFRAIAMLIPSKRDTQLPINIKTY